MNNLSISHVIEWVTKQSRYLLSSLPFLFSRTNATAIWFIFDLRVVMSNLSVKKNILNMSNGKCHLCQGDNNNLQHLFFQCPSAKIIVKEMEDLFKKNFDFEIPRKFRE